MENFLPALLIIGGVIYKIYSEYQKEQEKSRRRMPQNPLPPMPQVAGEQYPPPHANEPRTSIHTTPPKMERSTDVQEMVKRANERRKNSANSNELVVKPVVDLETENEEGASFDLRGAVIQSAILNRPYP